MSDFGRNLTRFGLINVLEAINVLRPLGIRSQTRPHKFEMFRYVRELGNNSTVSGDRIVCEIVKCVNFEGKNEGLGISGGPQKFKNLTDPRIPSRVRMVRRRATLSELLEEVKSILDVLQN